MSLLLGRRGRMKLYFHDPMQMLLATINFDKTASRPCGEIVVSFHESAIIAVQYIRAGGGWSDGWLTTMRRCQETFGYDFG